jgi:hypothetical protein
MAITKQNLYKSYLDQALLNIGESIELDDNTSNMLRNAMQSALGQLDDHLMLDGSKKSVQTKKKKKTVSKGKNGYQLYLEDEKSNNGKTHKEAMDSWKTLSEETKKNWSTKAKELKSSVAVESEEEEEVETKPKKKREYKPSAWSHFLKSYIATHKADGQKLSKTYMKDAGVEWKALSEDERKKYATVEEKNEVNDDEATDVEPEVEVNNENDDEVTDAEDEPEVVPVVVEKVKKSVASSSKKTVKK